MERQTPDDDEKNQLEAGDGHVHLLVVHLSVHCMFSVSWLLEEREIMVRHIDFCDTKKVTGGAVLLLLAWLVIEVVLSTYHTVS